MFCFCGGRLSNVFIEIGVTVIKLMDHYKSGLNLINCIHKTCHKLNDRGTCSSQAYTSYSNKDI
jgi:hypothetical protein